MVSAHLVETVPICCLPPSALVDALHLAAGTKEVVRTRLLDEANGCAIADWCQANRLAWKMDADRFLFVGKQRDVVDQALLIDRSPEPHEMAFGLLLGYPECCCRAVADAGEAEIDRMAASASGWEFCGEFRLIDPSGYATAEALISHVPCSPRCAASLRLARKALSFLEAHHHLLTCKNWQALVRRMQGSASWAWGTGPC